MIGYHSATINFTTFTTKKYTFRIADAKGLDSNVNRLVVRLYCKSDYAGEKITIRFGDFFPLNVDTGASKVDIDPPLHEWLEIGSLRNVEYGNSINDEEVTEMKPKSKIPINSIASMGNAIFEMPQSTLNRKSLTEQKDFEFLVYRGQMADLQEGTRIAGYCNFDVLDLKKEDYTNKLHAPLNATIDLSLAWHGEKGTLAQLYKNRLPWERYFKRPVELEMELTVNDITNHKIYHPFSVEGIHYIIDEISFDINENEEISNQKITAYTL